MPPKRRRDPEEDNASHSSAPRTPKRARKTIETTLPIGRTRSGQSRGSPSVIADGVVNEDDDEDDLTASQQPLARVDTRSRGALKNNGIPTKFTPTSRKSVLISNSTPTKSVLKGVANTKSRAIEDEETINIAAQLISDVQAAEHSDIEPFNPDESDDEAIEHSTNGFTMDGGHEAYFEQVSRPVRTSNNTLSRLPVLSAEDCRKAIKDYKPPYADAMKDLYDSHVSCFPEWSYELDHQYSLCLYGFGSKRSLIQDFAQDEADQNGYPYVLINGYHPRIDLRQICQAITSGLGSPSTDVQSVLDALDNMKYDRLVIAFHNIDGQNLRSEKFQDQFCRIAEHPRIRLICSIDHINAPLLFSTTRASRMSLLFHDATTFLPYTSETELLDDTLSTVKKAQLKGDRGIQWVLATVSKNAQTIFKILLTNQLAENGNGIESSRLFEMASRAFAVSSRAAYDTQLGEFFDHNLIVAEKESGIGDVLKIPYSEEELKDLLADIDAMGTDE